MSLENAFEIVFAAGVVVAAAALVGAILDVAPGAGITIGQLVCVVATPEPQ